MTGPGRNRGSGGVGAVGKKGGQATSRSVEQGAGRRNIAASSSRKPVGGASSRAYLEPPKVGPTKVQSVGTSSRSRGVGNVLPANR